MAGKRREYDGQFAMVDVNFILQDPRIYDLTYGERWLYLALWCLAVRERRETLPVEYSINRPGILARCLGVDPKLIKRALGQNAGKMAAKRRRNTPARPEQDPIKVAKLPQKGLIAVNENSTLTVVGVRDKHPGFKWKDDDSRENIDPLETEEEEEEEEEIEIETESESEYSPAAPNDSTHAPDHSGTNAEFDAVVVAMVRRCGRPPTAAVVQSILTGCKQYDWNPLDLIAVADNPFAVLADLARGGHVPDDWGDRIGGWGKFLEVVYSGEHKPAIARNPQPIGNILANIKGLQRPK